MALSDDVAALLRAGAHADAERVLTEALSGRTGSVASACMATSAESVRVSGWEELDASLSRGIREGAITAVGIDLSNYNDTDAEEWWDKEPALEVCCYTDDAFGFSTATRQELLEAGERYAAPWPGRMSGDVGSPLRVTGLRRLNGALLGADGDESAPLGEWWLKLRFRQALARDLEARGLALRVPVIVGSHDVGPWLVTVQDVPRVSDHHGSTARILAARDQANREAYDRVTRETVDELRTLRATSRKSWGFGNRDKRKKYVALADAHLAMVCSIAGLPKQKGSIAHMHDDYFEGLLASYVAWRQNRAQGS